MFDQYYMYMYLVHVFIEYSSDHAQAGLSLCWSHIPHCWKCHAAVTPIYASLANSEDPDEKPHNLTFQQGLHCSLRRSLENEMQFYSECMHVTCGPSNYTMDHPQYILSNQEEDLCDHLVHFKGLQLRELCRI